MIFHSDRNYYSKLYSSRRIINQIWLKFDENLWSINTWAVRESSSPFLRRKMKKQQSWAGPFQKPILCRNALTSKFSPSYVDFSRWWIKSGFSTVRCWRAPLWSSRSTQSRCYRYTTGALHNFPSPPPNPINRIPDRQKMNRIFELGLKLSTHRSFTSDGAPNH